ncbi:MAG TPA: hypothetical protein VM914_02735 [Pyrinomonadaceae bacterium]|nr:hypothetical protein [Pyrinomonadaceae bacterium]
MTTCPCCGEKFEGELSDGCASCGARPVGPPLARPERELPGYGHALAVCAAGFVLLAVFAFAVVAALLQRETFALGADILLRAAETAAWRLKWTALPLALLLSLVCAKLYARMRREPARFVGHAHARVGLALVFAVAVALTTFVGVTVPERLRVRELARRAAENALLYETDIALDRYKRKFGTYPATISDLRRLEDPDGSVARLLDVIAAGEYKPETDIASLATGRAKARSKRRGTVIRARASNSDDLPGGSIVLTNYEVTLPGRDLLLGTDDDLYIRDGLILDSPRPAARSAASPSPTARAH